MKGGDDVIKATACLYGSRVLLRMYCENCKEEAFVINGEYQCCDGKAEIPNIIDLKRICGGATRRTNARKIKTLERQDYKCIYCGSDLPGLEWNERKQKYIPTKYHVDHFVPWIYSQNNDDDNLVASCALCNLLKSDKYFPTIESARVYILEQRKKRHEKETI